MHFVVSSTIYVHKFDTLTSFSYYLLGKLNEMVTNVSKVVFDHKFKQILEDINMISLQVPHNLETEEIYSWHFGSFHLKKLRGINEFNY